MVYIKHYKTGEPLHISKNIKSLIKQIQEKYSDVYGSDNLSFEKFTFIDRTDKDELIIGFLRHTEFFGSRIADISIFIVYQKN